MVVKKAIKKTKFFFHKTIQNLRSFLNKEHHKLHTSSSLNLNLTKSAQFSEDFSQQSEPYNNDKMMECKSTITLAKEANNEKGVHFGSFKKGGEQIFMENKSDEREITGDRKMGSYREGKGESCSKIARGGDYVLARKMKELEMMETSDVDQVLDIQEVLHYYSGLTSPSYLEIVDRFYIDMHSEYPLPQPSKGISNSSRRLGRLKI